MRRRPRRDIEVFSLSFLDCICCGFGAIILLLTLVKMGEPRAIEQAREDLKKRIARLQEELYEIRGETDILSRELVGKREQLSRDTVAVARLQGDLEKMRGQFKASKELSQVQDAMQGRFLAAQQQLTEEMKRLKEESERPAPVRGLVGGIPVDSEYVIFVIDTSGSMQRYAWPLLLRKMTEILDAYPKVKGLQVMNDRGSTCSPAMPASGSPTPPAAGRPSSSASPPGTRTPTRARWRGSRPPSSSTPGAT